MTPREARRQRREAERKSLKKSRKAEAASASQTAQPEPVPSPAALTPETANNDAAMRAEIRARIDRDNQRCEERLRAETNRQSSLRSTGPRTREGKLASSRNSFKHGLYSKALVLPSEDSAELEALKADLRSEHQPADTTEEILVNELAEQYWRLRRMRRYETEALVGDTKYDNWFALMALIGRTMASAERGFHKSLTALRQMQKARGFVPQNSATPQQTKEKAAVLSQPKTKENDEAAVLSEPKTQAEVFVPQKAHSPTPESTPEPDFPMNPQLTDAETLAELQELEDILATSRAA